MTHFKRKGASTDMMVLTSLMWMLQCVEVHSTSFRCLEGSSWPALDGTTAICSPYFYQCRNGTPKLISCGSLYNSLHPYEYVFSPKSKSCISRDSIEYYTSGCSTISKYELPSACQVFGNIRCINKGYIMCVTKAQLCNGVRDCESNEDENHCDYHKPSPSIQQNETVSRGGIFVSSGNIKIFSVVIPVVLGLIAVPLFIITVLCLKQYCSADERRHRRVRARQSRRSESSHCTEINSSGIQKEFVTLDVNSFLPPTYDEALLGNFASSTENLCSKDDETEEPSSPPPYDIVASILGNHPSLSAEGGNADASTEATPAADCNSSIQGSTIHVNIIDVQEAGAPMTTDLVDHSVLISTPAQVDS